MLASPPQPNTMTDALFHGGGGRNSVVVVQPRRQGGWSHEGGEKKEETLKDDGNNNSVVRLVPLKPVDGGDGVAEEGGSLPTRRISKTEKKKEMENEEEKEEEEDNPWDRIEALIPKMDNDEESLPPSLFPGRNASSSSSSSSYWGEDSGECDFKVLRRSGAANAAFQSSLTSWSSDGTARSRGGGVGSQKQRNAASERAVALEARGREILARVSSQGGPDGTSMLVTSLPWTEMEKTMTKKKKKEGEGDGQGKEGEKEREEKDGEDESEEAEEKTVIPTSNGTMVDLSNLCSSNGVVKENDNSAGSASADDDNSTDTPPPSPFKQEVRPLSSSPTLTKKITKKKKKPELSKMAMIDELNTVSDSVASLPPARRDGRGSNRVGMPKRGDDDDVEDDSLYPHLGPGWRVEHELMPTATVASVVVHHHVHNPHEEDEDDGEMSNADSRQQEDEDNGALPYLSQQSHTSSSSSSPARRRSSHEELEEVEKVVVRSCPTPMDDGSEQSAESLQEHQIIRRAPPPPAVYPPPRLPSQHVPAEKEEIRQSRVSTTTGRQRRPGAVSVDGPAPFRNGKGENKTKADGDDVGEEEEDTTTETSPSINFNHRGGAASSATSSGSATWSVWSQADSESASNLAPHNQPPTTSSSATTTRGSLERELNLIDRTAPHYFHTSTFTPPAAAPDSPIPNHHPQQQQQHNHDGEGLTNRITGGCRQNSFSDRTSLGDRRSSASTVAAEWGQQLILGATSSSGMSFRHLAASSNDANGFPLEEEPSYFPVFPPEDDGAAVVQSTPPPRNDDDDDCNVDAAVVPARGMIPQEEQEAADAAAAEEEEQEERRTTSEQQTSTYNDDAISGRINHHNTDDDIHDEENDHNNTDDDDDEDETKPEDSLPIHSVEISPGKFLPLRGSKETWGAIVHGFDVRVTCPICYSKLRCVRDAEMVLCPECRVLSPVLSRVNEGGGGVRGGKEVYQGVTEEEGREEEEEDSDDDDNVDGEEDDDGGSNRIGSNKVTKKSKMTPSSHRSTRRRATAPSRVLGGATTQPGAVGVVGGVGLGVKEEDIQHHQHKIKRQRASCAA